METKETDEKGTAMVRREVATALVATSYRKIYDEEALRIIRANKCAGATDLEFAGLMTIAAMRGLNPMTGQIHFVKRKSKDPDTGEDVEKWVPQIGIDGFRSQAARTDEYDGQDEAEFEYVGGERKPGQVATVPILARVKVYRKGITRAFVGVAHYAEYVQTYYDRKKGARVPNTMWRDKPHIMLAKCAEALAMRKAFPEELGDLHIPEEIDDGREVDVLERAAEHGAAPATTAAPAAQPAQKRPTSAERAAHWRPLVEAGKTAKDLDALAAQMNADKDLVNPERKELIEFYKECYAKVRAANPQRRECPECKLVGTHAEACSKFEPPITGDTAADAAGTAEPPEPGTEG